MKKPKPSPTKLLFKSSSSIQVPVNDVPIQVLVDTGAALSLIHIDTLQRMKHSPIQSCSLKEVHTANSGFLSLLGLVKLDIKINSITTSVDTYVTNDLVCSMILGRDWIEQHQVNIDFSTHRIYIHSGLASVPLLPPPPTEPLIMSLPHPIVIPPYHQQFIIGTVPVCSLDDALFTPNIALQHARMVLLPHALIRIRNNRGIISILNNTRHSKLIPRNTPLGYVCPSPTTMELNVVQPSTSLSRDFSSFSLSSLSCPHCSVSFSSETTLYDHLLHCCNKYVSCPTPLINSLLQHIIDPVEKIKIYLMLHHYHHLFDNSCTQGISCPPQHAIDTGSHSPLAEHPRRVSHLNRQIINSEIEKMLPNGIIEPSNSSWASPVVIVKKPDGSPRFCVDYRRLNSITRKDVYPLPRIDDVIERLNGSRLFSKLDLRSGYFQVPLAPAERHKTAFTTPDGLWQFTRLPQGLKNSPAVFQRLMNQTLGSLRWDICLAYLDDIIVYSSSFDQHLVDVHKVCAALHSANFKLNSDKCAFFQHEISFLGHKITAAGCSPNDDNVRSILQFPTPQSSKAAHSFLQMVGFYTKFIPRFAQLSAPLNKFTRKDFPFIWTDTEQSSFDQLKAAITSPAVLILPDPSQPYIIRTDASRVGVGAVLLQKLSTNPHDKSTLPTYKPVAFASRSLKPAEKKYSAIELEALAIWWSVTQKFRSYIEGQPFLLETDHKPLISLMKKPYQNARIERWMTTLQQYDMTIQHISGKDNTTADALSRYPADQPDITDDDTARLVTSSTQTDDLFINMVTTRSMKKQLDTTVFPPLHISSPSSNRSTLVSKSFTPALPNHSSSADPHDILFDYTTLQLHQDQDPAIQKIKTVLPLNPNYLLDHHHVLHRLVTRKNGSILRLPCVPVSLITKVLFTYHNSTCNGAHFGIKRTFYKIRDRFFWPNMYNDIKQHVLSCINCQQVKPSRRKPDGHLQSIEPPEGVWQRLAMDHVGPVPSSKNGNKYFIVLTDLFSKFVVTKAVPDNTSTTAAKFLLYDVFMIYGVPHEVITDNGSHFSSSLYESLLLLTGCCHIKTTPYNPQANGQCERHNATLVPNLVALSNNSRSDWDDKLLATTFNYNTTRHTSTSYTPFELMFARSPRFPADLSLPLSSHSFNIPHFYDTMKQFIEHIKSAARNNNIHHQRVAKQRFDQNRSNPQYSIGQSVLIRNRQPNINKFSPRFVGPYIIITQLHNKTYVVEQVTRRNHRRPSTERI